MEQKKRPVEPDTPEEIDIPAEEIIDEETLTSAREKATSREDAEEVETESEKDASTEGGESEPAEKTEEEDPLRHQLLRLQADFQNFRKRAEKDRQDTVRYANEKLLIQLLDVADNFERALLTEKEHDKFFEGMEMIHQQLVMVLTKNGVEEIEAEGKVFDPSFHNALMSEDSDEVESGHVIRTFQKGYLLNGKLIRPAMVAVAK